MQKIKTLGINSVIEDIILFTVLIVVHEYPLPNLQNAFMWFMWFCTVMIIIHCLSGIKLDYTFSARKQVYEYATNFLLGFVLAYYQYYWLASLFTFFSLFFVNKALESKKQCN